MSDDKLTAVAAKAAGITDKGFSPLTDDGDALRLAVELGINIEQWPEGYVCAGHRYPGNFEQERHNDDPCAATRRAIVRAAAEIGRSKE